MARAARSTCSWSRCSSRSSDTRDAAPRWRQSGSLETSASPDAAELAEVRDGLLALTRRELLFDAQRQVLEGKQRVLARFLQRLVEIDNSLAAMGGGATRPAPVASAGLRALAAAAGGSGAPGLNQPAMAMRSQEDLRRDIVAPAPRRTGPVDRQHRPPGRDRGAARPEGGSSRHRGDRIAAPAGAGGARQRPRTFIFEIRPMVLDDLGLGPTVRRITARPQPSLGYQRRLRLAWHRGPPRHRHRERRLSQHRESIAGYLALRPPSVLVRLDWRERELVATVEGTWPRISPEGQSESSDARRSAIGRHASGAAGDDGGEPLRRSGGRSGPARAAGRAWWMASTIVRARWA